MVVGANMTCLLQKGEKLIKIEVYIKATVFVRKCLIQSFLFLGFHKASIHQFIQLYIAFLFHTMSLQVLDDEFYFH